jgi:hypothetical protein
LIPGARQCADPAEKGVSVLQRIAFDCGRTDDSPLARVDLESKYGLIRIVLLHRHSAYGRMEIAVIAVQLLLEEARGFRGSADGRQCPETAGKRFSQQ